MSDSYQKIINKQGLKTCPFCGKAVSIRIESILSNIKNLRLMHTYNACIFEKIERIVENEAQVKNFLDDWNRRNG
jgi:hypothetical protein